MLKKFILLSICVFVAFAFFVAFYSSSMPFDIVQDEYTKTTYYYLEEKIDEHAEGEKADMLVDSRYYSLWKEDGGSIVFAQSNCEQHENKDGILNSIEYIKQNRQSFPCTIEAYGSADFYDFSKPGFLCGSVDGSLFVAKETNAGTYYAFEHMSHMPTSLWTFASGMTTFTFVTLIIITAGILWAILTAMPLRKAIKKQEQFLQDASHELKLPLSVIDINNGIVRRNSQNLTQEQKEMLESNIEQTARMKALIDSMMSAIRKDSPKNKLALMEISASDIILERALNFETLAFEKEKTLITDIEENIFVMADRLRLMQIADILLDNALKYSDAGTQILIGLKKHAGKAYFSVTSFGEQIKKSDQKKIFDRFYRVDTSRHGANGHGLGLTIAKNNADAMKMKLFVANEGKYGTTFTLVMKTAKK